MADGVVLLHGIARTSASMATMRDALEAAAFTTLNLDYDSRHGPIDRLAEDVNAAIEAFSETTEGRLHVVTHSMGGLVARFHLARHRPSRLGRVVMLGPPNNGSEIADLLRNVRLYRAVFGPAGQQLTTRYASTLPDLLGPVDYPLGVIAGTRSIDPLSTVLILPRPNDGKVTVHSTRLDGMTDHVTVRAAHPWLMRNRAAIGHTISFLRHGRFADFDERSSWTVDHGAMG